MTRFFPARLAVRYLLGGLLVWASVLSPVAAWDKPSRDDKREEESRRIAEERAREAMQRQAEAQRERARERERERDRERERERDQMRREREFEQRQNQERERQEAKRQEQIRQAQAEANRQRSQQDAQRDRDRQSIERERDRLDDERRRLDRERRRNDDDNRPNGPMRPAPAGKPAAAAPRKKAPPFPREEAAPDRPLTDEERTAILADLDSGDAKRIASALDKLAKAAPAEDRAAVAARVAALLPDATPQVRRLASKALEYWATAAEIPALLGLLRAAENDVQLAAIHGLGALNDPRAIDPLAELFVESDVRAAAARSLKKLGDGVEPAMLKLLTHDDKWVRATAVDVLATVGGMASAPALRNAADSDDAEMVRERARMALRAIDDRKA